MRLTPAQIAVHHLCADRLPVGDEGQSLHDLIRSGRLSLRRLTGQDFGYDLARWHEHLKESREGGYTWGRNIALPRIMKLALESSEWREAVAALDNEQELPPRDLPATNNNL